MKMTICQSQGSFVFCTQEKSTSRKERQKLHFFLVEVLRIPYGPCAISWNA